MRLAALTALCSLAMPALAGELPLRQPIDCVLGDTCFIQQYVDHDPGPGARDFTCGPLSYDGHQGTDFGLPSFQAMRDGVAVLAAAPGTVRGLRDGMPDTGYGPDTAAAIQGKDCGNGVVIDHGDGWQTQYCHMKNGSVAVRKGQRIEAGAMLGQVGFSGRTQFPHLHVTLRKDGAVVDPFDPDGQITCGQPDPHQMWRSGPAYAPGGLLSAGFSTQIPPYDAVRDGTVPGVITPDSPALVLWGYAFGARAGDSLRMEILGPDGPVFTQIMPLDKPQAQFFRAGGKRRPPSGFAPGDYRGYIALIRGGQVVDDITSRLTIR